MSIIPEKRLKAAIGFIFVTAVLDIVAMGIIIPVLPQLIEEFVGSNARAGIINGLFVALWAGMQFVASPLFFGWIYSLSVGGGFEPLTDWLGGHGLGLIDAFVHAPGLAFYLSAIVLVLAFVAAFITARRAERAETSSVDAARRP